MIRQCCSILFPIITYPYIFRILGAANLGRYSFGDSVIQYVILLAELGVTTYAVREGAGLRQDKKAFNTFASEVFTINVLSMLVSYVLLIILVIAIPRFNQEKEIIAILSVEVFAVVIGREWLNTVNEDFRYMTVRYIVIQFIMLVAMFLLIKKSDDYLIYSAIAMGGYSLGFFVNVFYSRRYAPLRMTWKPNIRKHISPIMYLFCSTVAINIYVHSDILILGFYESNEQIGYYTVATKVYIVVKAVLNAITMVAIPRLSAYASNGEKEKYNHLLQNMRKWLYTLILPSIVGLWCLSRSILELLGGSADYAAGLDSLHLLSLALFFAVFGCFYAQGILIPNKKENVFFWATVISAVMNIVLNLIVIPFMGITGAALTTLIAEILILGICWYKSRSLHDRYDNKDVISSLAGCVVILGVCLLIRKAGLSSLLELIVSMAVAVPLYFFVLYIAGNSVIKDMTATLLYKLKRNNRSGS